MQLALRRKPSAQAIAIAVNVVTDVDRDGYGFGFRPGDPDPFDAAVRPYAVEIPGNGVDEDGVAGDLPVARVTEAHGPAVAGTFASRPDVLLVLLESVRADAVGASVGGQACHANPRSTRRGRRVLIAGVLAQRLHLSVALSPVHRPAGRRSADHASLIDDFKANGYRGRLFLRAGRLVRRAGARRRLRARRRCSTTRADDPARRYTQFTHAGQPRGAGDGGHRARRCNSSAAPIHRQPLFIYVNFHDTHFPYHHAGIEPLVSSTVVDQAAIAPERADALRDDVPEHDGQCRSGDRHARRRHRPRRAAASRRSS